MTAVVTKALRQLPKWANIPPTRGPIRTDMLQLVDISAMVRDQADFRKRSADQHIGDGSLQAAAESLNEPADNDPAHGRGQ